MLVQLPSIMQFVFVMIITAPMWGHAWPPPNLMHPCRRQRPSPNLIHPCRRPCERLSELARSLRPSLRPCKRPKYPCRRPCRRPCKRPSRHPCERPSRHPCELSRSLRLKYPCKRPKCPCKRPSLRPSLRPSKRPSLRPRKYPSLRPRKCPCKRLKCPCKRLKCPCKRLKCPQCCLALQLNPATDVPGLITLDRTHSLFHSSARAMALTSSQLAQLSRHPGIKNPPALPVPQCAVRQSGASC